MRGPAPATRTRARPTAGANGGRASSETSADHTAAPSGPSSRSRTKRAAPPFGNAALVRSDDGTGLKPCSTAERVRLLRREVDPDPAPELVVVVGVVDVVEEQPAFAE